GAEQLWFEDGPDDVLGLGGLALPRPDQALDHAADDALLCGCPQRGEDGLAYHEIAHAHEGWSPDDGPAWAAGLFLRHVPHVGRAPAVLDLFLVAAELAPDLAPGVLDRGQHPPPPLGGAPIVLLVSLHFSFHVAFILPRL